MAKNARRRTPELCLPVVLQFGAKSYVVKPVESRKGEYTMDAKYKSALMLIAGVSLVTGCVGTRFQTAAAKFGTETERAMTSQSEQIEDVSVLETERLRDEIGANKVLLALNDDCFDPVPGAQGQFKKCVLIERGSDNKIVPFNYTLPDILALQDALASYGANLAFLADAAEADQAAFSASVDKLGASIGKLDLAISKAAKTERLVSGEKISTIASVIGTLGKLVLKYQRRHALRRIVVANDPLVQEALALLNSAEVEVANYKRLAATQIARDAAAKTLLATNDEDRLKKNEALFRAVNLLNEIEINSGRLEKLAAIHTALANVAGSNDRAMRSELARKMLEDWTAD
jgi:hypothetical protein